MFESMVSSTSIMSMPGVSAEVRNIDAPRSVPDRSKVRAMMIAIVAPSAPVMSHFRPLIT